MFLSEDFQSLSTQDKCLWLQTPAGIAQLTEWLSAELTLFRIAKMLQINNGTIYKVCDSNPKIVAITGRPLTVKEDPSRPAAYRIILGFKGTRGTILAEYSTPEALWGDWRIKLYFKSFGVLEGAYFENYLKIVASSGFYRLSNTFCIVYGDVDKTGRLKSLIPPKV